MYTRGRHLRKDADGKRRIGCARLQLGGLLVDAHKLAHSRRDLMVIASYVSCDDEA